MLKALFVFILCFYLFCITFGELLDALPQQDRSQTTSSAINSKVETAKKTGLLSLSSAGLKEIPNSVFELTKLRVLDLSINRLTSLPSSIGTLLSLKTLDLHTNQLTSLCVEVASLSSLETLILDDNRLDENIFPDVSSLTKLTTLSVARNAFSKLPAAIFSLPLKKLNISENTIEYIDDCLSFCSTLQECNLSKNRIESFSPSINWPCLQRLHSLDLSENRLTPSNIPVGLLRDSCIHQLTLTGNLVAKEDLLQLQGIEEFISRRKEKIDRWDMSSTQFTDQLANFCGL